MQKVSEAVDVRAIALDRLAWVRRFHEAILAGVPDDALLARAGGAGNHALWVMGHVASTDAYFLSALGGKAPALPEGYEALFSGGSKVFDDASVYPGREEALETMRTSRTALVRWAQALDDQGLAAPLAAEVQAFAPNVISMLFTLGAHEMFHAGQVASVRASLGLAPALV